MMNREEILQKAIDTYGEESQKKMMIEEMSELTKELCKWFRGEADTGHILEEMADVQIMLDQMRMIFGDTSEQEKAKVERLGRRLKEISEEAQGKNYFAVRMKDGTVLGIPAEDVARSYAESQKAIGLNYEFQFKEMMKYFDGEFYQFAIWARRNLSWSFIQEHIVILKQPERDFEKEWQEGFFQFIHGTSKKEMQDK